MTMSNDMCAMRWYALNDAANDWRLDRKPNRERLLALVRKAREDGHSIYRIANATQVSPSTLTRWVKDNG